MGQTSPRLAADPEALFARHVVPELEVLLRIALALTRDPADAEDLVQETLLRAYRSIDRFDGQHPRAWLFTIMRNAQRGRARPRRPSLLDEYAGADLIPDLSRDRQPEVVVLDRALEAAIVEALADLPHRLAQVVRLVDVGGLSYAEAAQALGIPAGTVMSRLHRGRSRIRERLGQSGLLPWGEM